ncbi:MAG TPA: sugar ABC transporter permease [Kineosporiaceae bacterium]|nr:sugar ABC transporter permease [Kineosporiaceae bacterium]
MKHDNPPPPGAEGPSAAVATRGRAPLLTTGAPLSRRRLSGVSANSTWWFLIPAMLVYAFVILVPSARGVGYAFTDWDGLSPSSSFSGTDNFQMFFHDSDAIDAVWHTLVIAVANMVIQNVLGLLLALGVNTQIKTGKLLRVLFFAPAVMTPIVTAYLWRNLLSGDGAVNTLLGAVGLGGLEQSWLGDSDVVLWSIVFILTWQFAGYSMVIFLAGLQSIPPDIYEASDLDGAGPIRRFWYITRPLLAPAFTINLTLSMIGGIKLFDQVYGLTGGGPGTASQTITSWIVKNAFLLGEFSYASALAVILTVIVAAASIFQYVFLARSERKMS